MLQTYRRALAVPGAAAFSSAGLVARLPISMTGLGIVLLVSASTGSYGVAGALSATYVLAAGVTQPLLGRLSDAIGQPQVVVPAMATFLVGVVVLCAGVQQDWPRAWWFAGAVLTGASFPPWGSLVRARWAHALAERRPLLPTAFALEAVLDEVTFVAGPVLVTVLATAVHPTAGLLTAAALGTVGGLALVVQRRKAPPTGRATGTRSSDAPMGWSVLGPLAAASVGLGLFFGGAEVAAVAFAEEQGDRGDAGWVLAVWAAGSLVAGLVVGALPSVAPLRQFRVGACLLAATMTTTLVAGSTPVLAALLFCSGLAVSPTLIASVALVEQTVPAARLTEGMTWETTGLIMGVAPGAAVAGAVVDAADARTAFLVPIGGGLLAALLALTVRPRPTPPATDGEVPPDVPARRIGSGGGADQTVGGSAP